MPLIVMISCSFILFYEIKKKSENFFKISGNKQNRGIFKNRIKRNKQILYMLTATNIFFITCSLPYCILCFKSNFSSSQYSSFSQVLFIVHILSYSNNSFNFIFFLIFSNHYRQALYNLSRCRTSADDFDPLATQNASNSIMIHHVIKPPMKNLILLKRRPNIMNYQIETIELANFN